ncbi:MAG: hypothetical protein V2A53_05945 [bacterium]
MATSVVSTRGQAVIPVEIRKKYSLDKNSMIEWIDIGNAILLFPQGGDLIEDSFGMLKGARVKVEDILSSRKKDREMDEDKARRV